MEEKQRLLILYASQTGNAVDVAERIGREAECMGCAALVLSVGDFDVSALPLEEYVIFVASTTGQGEIPDSMKAFWRFLLRRNLAPDWLEGVYYALFGLGDSSYQKFNFAAKKLDKRLSDLGARAIIERGLGDDQHPFGYEGALDSWLSFLWKKLCQMKPVLFPRGYDSLEHGTKSLGRPKFEILYHSLDKMQSSTEISDLKCIELQIEKARFMRPQKFRQEENKPHCILQMIKNKFLSKPGCGKDVHHLEFQALSAINYEVGDVLEVLPSQDPVLVDAFICRCKMDPDSYITIRPVNDNKSDAPMNPVNLRSFVAHTMDVASASPRRYFFEVMSFFATAEHEKERLLYFASAEGRDDLYQYNQKERRTVLEVLEDFSSVQMPFEWMVQLVPPLLTRAFSISSSPSAHPNEIHLTVASVSLMTPFKRKRFGLCSSWLTGLDPKKEVHIPAWIHHGSLPPPPPTLPLILVGPGTGCAPFHAFIEERALQSRTGPTAPVLFFFGCRNEENDFLYRDFWLSHSKDNGVLSELKGGGFFVAFSRDQPQKIYVQHKMREEKERIWNLLSMGAAIYIAGSANKMPSDVLSAMEEIVSMESNVPRESATRWLKQLNSTGRYNVEAWM